MPPNVQPPAVPGNVSGDEIAFWRYPAFGLVIAGNFFEFGVFEAVGRGQGIYGLKAVFGTGSVI